ELTREPARVEGRDLTQRARPVSLTAHRELEPREAGQAHLGAQTQQSALTHLFDPPEVHGVADDEPARMVAPTAQAWPAAQSVEEPPHLPRERPRVPAPLAA